MKKIYIKPQLNLFTIKTRNLLQQASQQFGALGDAGGSTVVLSRKGNSDWDDDEEE